VSTLSPDTHRRFLYRDSETLKKDIRSLALPIPWDEEIGPLLEPVRVGPCTLPNRLAVHPMEGFDGDDEGSPGEPAIRRYGRYATGGAGLIWFEATAVAKEGRSNPHQLCLHRGSAGAFQRLVAETRRAATEALGPGHRPLLILQLTHSGRWSRPGEARRPVIAHHLDWLDRMVGIDESHPVISDEELDRLQEVFLDAARLAAEAGFDGVDVKACHGYLVSELLASFTREGRYGGTLENRSRFLLEVVRWIRAELPGLLVTSRMNVFDGVAYPHGFGVSPENPEEPELAEPLQLLRRLKEEGGPLAGITLGVPYLKPHLGRPYNRAVPGSPSAPEHPLVGIARFLELTGRLQRGLPDLPLVGTGYSWLRHFFPHVGAAAVRSGGVSIVGVGRMAFAYPGFARDLLEKGALDPRKSCVGCSGCSELMKLGWSTGCVVRDGDLYYLPPKSTGKAGRS
jgi:2,4-dienoyl-CoA reductase (NADPH2)